LRKYRERCINFRAYWCSEGAVQKLLSIKGKKIEFWRQKLEEARYVRTILKLEEAMLQLAGVCGRSCCDGSACRKRSEN
jgi:hypothetical protein